MRTRKQRDICMTYSRGFATLCEGFVKKFYIFSYTDFLSNFCRKKEAFSYLKTDSLCQNWDIEVSTLFDSKEEGFDMA